MRTLILIKHSLPRIEPAVRASHWRLSDEGRLRCTLLADALVSYAPEVIFCSVEPKARETAKLVSKHLSIPCHPFTGLHEHERSHAPFLPQTEFERLLGEVFRHPDRRAFGEESGRDASRRFGRAVEAAVGTTDAGCVAVAAHGTVISLFAGECGGCDPFDLWRQLELPSFVVLSGLPWRIQKVVPRLDPGPRQPSP